MNIIKNVFLPEKIGSNYIFKKTILAISINKTIITAVKAAHKVKIFFICQLGLNC